jgi:hypothetical protein
MDQQLALGLSEYDTFLSIVCDDGIKKNEN